MTISPPKRITMVAEVMYSGTFYPKGLVLDLPEIVADDLIVRGVAIHTPLQPKTKDVGALAMASKMFKDKFASKKKVESPSPTFRGPRPE